MTERYDWIPLSKIDCDPLFHLRQHWDPARDPTLPALARSLAGPEGLIHPIVVVTRLTPTTFGRLYTLVAGHRRLAAARAVGWERLLARILPPCDLHLPQERLRLLAIAIRENTERAPLETADRRAALARLKLLYDDVYPGQSHPVGHEALTPEDTTAFTRWATRATQIPAYTLRRDLRRLFVAAQAPSASQTFLAPTSAPPAPGQDPLPYALSMGQQASAALQALRTHLTPEQRALVPPEHHTQLVDTLQELQTTLSMAWTATTMPTARSLDAFALLIQQRVPPLLGALRGLATSPRKEWEEAPPVLLKSLQQTMTTLLHNWAQIEAALDAARSQPPSSSRPRRQEGAV